MDSAETNDDIQLVQDASAMDSTGNSSMNPQDSRNQAQTIEVGTMDGSENDGEMDWDYELRECARYGEFEELKVALENHAQLNSTDDLTGNTALHFASANGNIEIVRYLLETYKGKKSAQAEKLQNIDQVSTGVEKPKQLLDVNIANKSGNSALHYAAQNKHPLVALLLLEYGSHPAMENSFGKTPLDEAESRGAEKVKSLLLKWVEDHPASVPQEDEEISESDSDSSSEPMSDDHEDGRMAKVTTDEPTVNQEDLVVAAGTVVTEPDSPEDNAMAD